MKEIRYLIPSVVAISVTEAVLRDIQSAVKHPKVLTNLCIT